MERASGNFALAQACCCCWFTSGVQSKPPLRVMGSEPTRPLEREKKREEGEEEEEEENVLCCCAESVTVMGVTCTRRLGVALG